MKKTLHKIAGHPIVQLLAWLITIQAIGALVSSFSMPGPWYYKLNRSSLTPSDWVFPIAWTTLYACLAVFGWDLWRNNQATSITKTLFIIQLSINYSWSFIFFKLQFVSLALLLIAVMIAINITIIMRSIYEKTKTWFLLVPYVMWLIFAYYLTNYILNHL